MKRFLLLTAIGIFILCNESNAQANIFDPSDPIVDYNPNAPAGSQTNPSTNWNTVQKWVVTEHFSWDSAYYKSYHFAGMSFRIKFPKTYQHNVNDGKKYPVMLFWHGAGEKGTIYDNELQLLHGGQLFMNRVNSGQFDGFLFYPQNTSGYFGSSYYSLCMQMLDSLAKYCKLDVDRVFIDGLSAGGQACFDMLTAYPDRVAKAAPASAASTGAIPYIPGFIHIPIWMCTGHLDSNPTPFMAQEVYDSIHNRGADILWTEYPDLGHFTWDRFWQEPNFVPYMNDLHKANPLIYFQHNQFCPDLPTNARLGITAGFYQYEWSKDGVVIPGATSNEYIATSYGTYAVHFKRKSTSNWSAWSPKPAVISQKFTSQTPDIQIVGLRSKVVPAPDGSTTTPLKEPKGYVGYEWVRISDNALVGADSIYNAPAGQYKARIKEQFGCNAFYSPVFTIIDANGVNKPDPAKNLTAFPLSQSSIELDWSDNPNPAFNETNFEIYRATKSGGPYQLIGMVGTDILTYVDQGLLSNTTYYYLVRAVNNYGASANSNQALSKTQIDNIPPTTPGNLRIIGVTRFQVYLQWDPSTDNVGVDKYDIYVNGSKLFTTDKTLFIANGLDSFQTYNIAVRARDVAGNKSPLSNQVTAFTKFQGLVYYYYEGNWAQLPNFSTLPILKSGMVANTDLTLRNTDSYYGFLWQGYIKIPTTGTYTFETNSDDGSKLYINQFYDPNATPLVNNDGLHGAQSRTGTITLNAGIYPITITYFQGAFSMNMNLYWSNNVGMARQAIPNSAFSDANTSSGTIPTAPSNLIATATRYDKINLSWTDNSNNETGFEVARSTSSSGPFLNVFTSGPAVTSYVDSGLLSSTNYYYKVRAIGTAGESSYSNTANATTLALPSLPADPSNLNATAVSPLLVNLGWNTNSSNASTFEVYRSSKDTLHYRLLTSIPGGPGATRSLADSGVFPNTNYYYKVRAMGIGGATNYTNTAFTKTLNTNPVMSPVLDFTMRYGTADTLAISASDVDGDALTFSTLRLPSFGSVSNVINGNAIIVFTPSYNNQGSYLIKLYISDGNGGKDSTDFTLIVNQNYPPTLNPISNVGMDEGSDTTINLIANDVESPSYINWTFNGLPSFAQFIDNGNGNGAIRFRPGYAASGVYSVNVTVDDGFGGWIARAFTITVRDKDPNEKILVKVKYNTTGPAPWNNWATQSTSNLKNTLNINTTIGISVLNSWQYYLGEQGAQTGDNSGVYPDAVMKDFIYWGFFQGNNLSDTSTLRITGLNPAKLYSFTFFASSTFGGYTSSLTTYKSGSQSVTINAANNTTNRVVLNQLSPDNTGTISITMIGDPDPDKGGYLNALEIAAQYDDGTAPARPTNFNGKFIEHNGVQLNWTDVAYNEIGYKIYRGTSKSGPYTLLNPNPVNTNAVFYKDSTASPLTQYYYYTKAYNLVGDSPSSDTASVLTGNNSPVITNLTNIFVKTYSTANETFKVTCDPGNILTVSSPNLPSFLSLQNLGSSNYKLVANPVKDNLGIYDVTINAADDKGGLTTQNIVVQVADKNTRSYYLNFGSDGKYGGAPWNDLLGFGYDGKNVKNLKDEAGVATNVAITYRDSWSGNFDLGFITGNNSGVFRDSVLRSAIYASDAVPHKMKFTGLSTLKRYNVVFIGSADDGLTALANYSATGATSVSLNGRYNAFYTVQLNHLTPVGDSIIVTIQKDASATYMYMNAMVLEEYTDTTAILNPIHLVAEPVDKNSVKLNWADRSYNETGFEIYRATSSGGPYTLITTSGINSTTYTNTGLSSNTRYYYQVRAKLSPVTFSDYSNIASTITPKTITYVNLTFTYPAGLPWNNFNANPDAGVTLTNMLTDQNTNPGTTITINKNFNGQFDAGMQTFSTGGIFPDNVMRSNYWTDRLQISQFKISGMNQSKRYRIGFFGSTGPGWYDGDFTATYTIGNRTVYLNSHRNDSKVVYIGDVVPDQNGEVLLNVSTTSNADYGFTAAMLIETYDDASGGTVLNAPNNNLGTIVASANENNSNKTPGSSETSARTVKMDIYPNPFVDNLKIDFYNNSVGSQMAIEVYDLRGRLVYSINKGKAMPGYNSVRLNVKNSDFSPGLYIVKLNLNGQVVGTAKLLKSRKN